MEGGRGPGTCDTLTGTGKVTLDFFQFVIEEQLEAVSTHKPG